MAPPWWRNPPLCIRFSPLFRACSTYLKGQQKPDHHHHPTIFYRVFHFLWLVTTSNPTHPARNSYWTLYFFPTFFFSVFLILFLLLFFFQLYPQPQTNHTPLFEEQIPVTITPTINNPHHLSNGHSLSSSFSKHFVNERKKNESL